jgi:hypothetical protein
MLRKLLGFLLTMACGAGLMACVYEFHVLRTPNGVEFVRKPSPDWHDPFVDVRGWTVREWAAHPRLVKNLALAKRADIMESSGTVPLPPSWLKPTSWSRSRDADELSAEELPADELPADEPDTDSPLGPSEDSDEALDATGQPRFEDDFEGPRRNR